MKKLLCKIMLLSFCLASLFLNACSSPSPTPKTLYGYVTADDNISGAGIKVVDMSGNVIAEQKGAATSDYGVFVITVPDLPSKFRVVSTGGKESGQAVDYELAAQFENFDPDNGIIYINMVTTMVCAYLDLAPDKSLAKATEDIKEFLSIPSEIDIQEWLYHIDTYFNHDVFKNEVEESGGDLDAYIAKLLTEMSKDPSLAYIFNIIDDTGTPSADQTVRKSSDKTSSLLASMAFDVAKAAASGAIGWGANYVLNQVAGGGDVDVMKKELIQIQTQLTTLNAEVLASKNEITAAIADANLQRAFDNVNTQEKRAKNIFQKLKLMILYNPKTPQEIQDHKTTINALLEEIKSNDIRDMSGFNGFLMGTNEYSNNGLFPLYAQMIKTKYKFLSKENYQDKVTKLALYYNHIETILFYLACEYNSVKAPLLVKIDADTLTENSTTEQKWLNSVKPMSNEIIIYNGKNPKLMIYEGSSKYTFVRDGKTLTGKPPIYGTFARSEQIVYDFNQYINPAGFNNWRKITRAELEPIFNAFVYGQITTGKYLENMGWVTEYGDVGYVGADTLGNEQKRICYWLCGTQNSHYSEMKYETFYAREMRFLNYWHTIRNSYWVYPGDDHHGYPTRGPDAWHWIIVRTVGNDENYIDYTLNP
jgi:hypothetical protein